MDSQKSNKREIERRRKKGKREKDRKRNKERQSEVTRARAELTKIDKEPSLSCVLRNELRRESTVYF